jgi:hypothetical protein
MSVGDILLGHVGGWPVLNIMQFQIGQCSTGLSLGGNDRRNSTPISPIVGYFKKIYKTFSIFFGLLHQWIVLTLSIK